MKILWIALFVCALSGLSPAQEVEKKTESPPIQINGVFPNVTTIAEYNNPTEAGIGALLPWAGRLWFVSYVAHKRGEGQVADLSPAERRTDFRSRLEHGMDADS